MIEGLPVLDESAKHYRAALAVVGEREGGAEEQERSERGAREERERRRMGGVNEDFDIECIR